jgi:pyruvate-formate lyase-activating enzyme
VFTKLKFSHGCNFSCLGGCNPNYIKIVYCNIGVGFAMDSIMFARHTFLEVGESLVVACESDDNVEAQATVDKGVIACGVFNIV